MNAARKGQTCSDHKLNDEARPNCLSFSKTPLNELLKMKENLMKENVAEATVPMSQPTPSRSEICGKKRRNSEKLCRFCGGMSSASDLYCPNCGNLQNKRGRY